MSDLDRDVPSSRYIPVADLFREVLDDGELTVTVDRREGEPT